MRSQLEQRIEKLRQEFDAGRRSLADIENRQAELRSTLLRISGAIQVLEEILGEQAAPSDANIKVVKAS